MARRRKKAPAGAGAGMRSSASWCAGVILALVSFVVLHRMAALTAESASGASPVGGFLHASLVAELAGIGQVILPIFFLVVALVSFLKR